MKQDKRFARSERIIREAFLELLETKSYAEIKVTEICQLADCSRNAFYLHYETKEHLLSSIVREITDNIQQSCQPVVKSLNKIGENESRKYTDQILQAIDRNKKVVSILLKQNQMNFLRCLSHTMVESMIEHTKPFNVSPNIPLVVYFSSGICGFIDFWLTTDLSLEEAQDILHQTVFNQSKKEYYK